MSNVQGYEGSGPAPVSGANHAGVQTSFYTVTLHAFRL